MAGFKFTIGDLFSFCVICTLLFFLTFCLVWIKLLLKKHPILFLLLAY